MFRIITIAWCEVSTLAVILTGDIPFGLALAVLVLIPLFGLPGEGIRWLAPLRAASSVVAVSYLVFFPLDWVMLSGRLIFAVVHLIFYLKLHTLLHLQGPRDRSRLYCLCLFEMLAAASMTVDLSFLVPLVAFVLLGSMVLMMDQVMLRSGRRAGEGLQVEMVRPALGLGAGILLLAAGIFVLLPRTGYTGFRLGGFQPLASTGITDRVELGDFGRIKRSSDVVMRIVAGRKGAETPPRWRGAVFDRYSNGRWSQTLGGLLVLSGTGKNEFSLAPLGEDSWESEVYLEPLDTDVLFLPPGPLRLTVSLRYLFIDRYLSLRTGRPANIGRRYLVEWKSGTPRGAAPLGGVAPFLEAYRSLYLQMPDLSPEFLTLAKEVAPPGDAAQTAAAVESYLQSNYSYTLDSPPRRRADPLEDFLFEARAGHCEYFATAMVAILRAREVPARLVTGFQRGQRNEVGDFEVVRKSEAHAWVEVFEPGAGWLTYDPTPAAPLGPEGSGGSLFSKGIDSLRMLWDMYVITFDYERQRGLLGGTRELLRRSLAGMAGSLRERLTHLRRLGPLLLLLALGTALAWLGARRSWATLARLRFRWGGRRFHRSPESAVRFYASVLARLERLGFRRPSGETPAEYASALETEVPGLSELTRVYYQVRFGGRSLSREEKSRAERLAVSVQMAAWSAARVGGASGRRTQVPAR
jgi:transglutaminase-like putative cysteine protease